MNVDKTIQDSLSQNHSGSQNQSDDMAIEIQDLHKTYKATGTSPEKTALHGINLSIPKGSIFGLLGPNGAGKSTIINIMASLTIKTSGTVKIWGMDIDKNPRNARSAIGIVPQEINLDPFFTPAQVLDIQGGLYGVPKAQRRTRELLQMVRLEDKANAWARSLSGGMRRRLMVAKAMVHTPPILVLDEPTAGVDVELRKELWSNVRRLNEQGTTILLTTHYLEEAEELCDQIAIINHGRVIACEDKENILSRIDNKEIHFRMVDVVAEIPNSLQQFNPEKSGKRTLIFRYSPEEIEVETLIQAIHAENMRISDISTDESDLEDVFLQLTRNG